MLASHGPKAAQTQPWEPLWPKPNSNVAPRSGCAALRAMDEEELCQIMRDQYGVVRVSDAYVQAYEMMMTFTLPGESADASLNASASTDAGTVASTDASLNASADANIQTSTDDSRNKRRRLVRSPSLEPTPASPAPSPAPTPASTTVPTPASGCWRRHRPAPIEIPEDQSFKASAIRAWKD